MVAIAFFSNNEVSVINDNEFSIEFHVLMI
jgi:hypothetical protein